MSPRERGRRGAAVGCLLVLGLAAAPVAAHPLAPALLELRERDAGRVSVLWKTSSLRVPGADVRPALPGHCRPVGIARLEEGSASRTTRWELDCGAAGLVGQAIAVEDLAAARIDVLARIQLADGRSVQQVLSAREPALVVPARQTAWQLARGYGRLGIEHILTGVDHLLFVFGLLLLVRGVGPLVRTVTAFTVGHSCTLSLAALGFVDFPTRPIELAIALSVFALALELARREPGRPGLLRRLPWVMACGFGFLHGLGFAGALAEVGLPEGEVPLALAAFNVGIELGQLAFVTLVLAVRGLVADGLARLPRWTEALPIYALGSLSALWCFERAAALLR